MPRLVEGCFLFLPNYEDREADLSGCFGTHFKLLNDFRKLKS
jgi:hypothetical protein